MNDIEKAGKKNTILISISILLVSLHTIYFYQSVQPEIDTKKLIQQIIRFLLTVGLLYAIYIGKNWARIIALILFSLGILGAIYGIFTIQADTINKVPFIVMIFVYSMALYHFGFSSSFTAFHKVQQTKQHT